MNRSSLPPPPGVSIFDEYRRSPEAYDELRDAGGDVRPPWRPLVDRLDRLGIEEIDRRWAQSQRLIRENGISFILYGDERADDRPWKLSPLPAVLGPQDWSPLAEGLRQRATLLEMVLADLHGPQNLLAEGLIPPALLFGNPNYLRPCHGLLPPRGRWLPLYAADVARGPDGRFRVLSDRTQAPSGAGYALENRIIIGRTLPEVFRDCRVHRLAPFFNTLKETLLALAPRPQDQPRVVLLSPGPQDPTYFEHAYLARYLGFTLVEGGDLTVRDARVFLKMLGGLQRVDVIVRRVPDALCDPLELRNDAFGGIPGLLQAVRDGNVAIANPIGTGLVHTPALLPYLPGVCRRLLGQDLMVPTVPTFWCGEAQSRQLVLDRLQGLVIKPAFPTGPSVPVFGGTLSAKAREELVAKIKAQPQAYVAQELVALSTTPELQPEGPQPRHAVLRAFLTASADKFDVMPGGLTRLGPRPDALEVSLRAGGGSKDTWVLSEAPVKTFSLLPQAGTTTPLSRGGGDLPSRVADNLFWLARYAERAEGIARLCRVIAGRRMEQAGDDVEVESQARLLQVLAESVGVVFAPEVGVDEALTRAVWSNEWIGSLKNVVKALTGLARMVRDRLSTDTFRILLALEDELREPSQDEAHDLARVVQAMDRMVLTLAAFAGLAMDGMTRGHAWRFLDLGRRLERASTITTLLAKTTVDKSTHLERLLEATLEVADSGITYRRRYPSRWEVAPAVDLLLTDETNPRSVAFQLQTLVEQMEALPEQGHDAQRSPQQKLALAGLTALRLADVPTLCAASAKGDRPALAQLLERLLRDLPALSDALSGQYLSHSAVSRQLALDPQAFSQMFDRPL